MMMMMMMMIIIIIISVIIVSVTMIDAMLGDDVAAALITFSLQRTGDCAVTCPRRDWSHGRLHLLAPTLSIPFF